MSITVVVAADDQTAVREGLAVMLGLLDDVEVIGEAADGEQAVELVAGTGRTWSSWTCGCRAATGSGRRG